MTARLVGHQRGRDVARGGRGRLPGAVDLGVGDGDGLSGRQLDAVEGADDDLADLLVDLIVGESGKSIGIGGDLVHGRLQRLQVAGIALAGKGDLGRGAVAVDIDRVDRVIEAAQVGLH